MISVVIPCFGETYAKFLPEAVASVQAQIYPHWEVVIAAGMGAEGDDSAYQAAHKLHKEDKRVFVVWVPALREVGKAEARNVGIRLAKGDWIVSLDADDILYPAYLMEAVNYGRLDNTSLVVPGFREFGLRESTWMPPIAAVNLDLSGEDGLRFGNIFSCASLFAKNLWAQVGGYEESDLNYEDWDLWLKFADATAARVSTIGGVPMFGHRIHEAADYSGASAEMQAIWLATLKMRHAHKMPLTPADFHALETMPESVKEKLRIRALHFPQNAHLKNLARYTQT
jgi:cellulose synthase/poly-beta-1,6-N-acetylglucosamine synthase-like glycosyltransferase